MKKVSLNYKEQTRKRIKSIPRCSTHEETSPHTARLEYYLAKGLSSVRKGERWILLNVSGQSRPKWRDSEDIQPSCYCRYID